MRLSTYKRRFSAGILLPALLIGLVGVRPVLAAGSVDGRVTGPAGVTPVAGARVVFYNLVTGTTATSEPTDHTGEYTVPDLLEGRYDVAVQTDRGLWLVARPVELGGGEVRQMSFALRESGYWENNDRQPPPASQLAGEVVGTAVILEDESASPERWPKERKRKALIGTAIGIGVLAIALAAGDSSSSSDASPFTP